MKVPEKPHNMEPDFRKNMAKWFQFIHIYLLLPSQYFPICCISTWDTFFYYLKKLSLSELNLAKWLNQWMHSMMESMPGPLQNPQVSVNLLHNWLISENIQRQVNMKCILCYIYSMRRSHFPITHETKATSLSKPEQRFQSKYLQHHEALIFLPIICCTWFQWDRDPKSLYTLGRRAHEWTVSSTPDRRFSEACGPNLMSLVSMFRKRISPLWDR